MKGASTCSCSKNHHQQEADALKTDDSIAMVCIKCKTVWVARVKQGTKGAQLLMEGGQPKDLIGTHACAGCKSTIEVVGVQKGAHTELKHSPLNDRGPMNENDAKHSTPRGALLLASATESRALPPRQHSLSGVIMSIDYDAHTITLVPAKGSKPVVFMWKDSTRFFARMEPHLPCAFGTWPNRPRSTTGAKSANWFLAK